jgi:hypothetical protein
LQKRSKSVDKVGEELHTNIDARNEHLSETNAKGVRQGVKRRTAVITVEQSSLYPPDSMKKKTIHFEKLRWSPGSSEC